MAADWCAATHFVGGDGELTISRRATINWLLLIYFASGACSLMDEVVWVRLLKLTFGHTVYASSVVVSVFMGGLYRTFEPGDGALLIVQISSNGQKARGNPRSNDSSST